jgi:hypothetical protein
MCKTLGSWEEGTQVEETLDSESLTQKPFASSLAGGVVGSLSSDSPLSSKSTVEPKVSTWKYQAWVLAERACLCFPHTALYYNVKVQGVPHIHDSTSKIPKPKGMREY